MRSFPLLICVLFVHNACLASEKDAKVLRAGMIGLDTSHAIAFARAFNDPKSTGDISGIRIVAAFPGGSPDLASSRDRVQGYTRQIRTMGIEIVDSIPALLDRVDVVLLESVDGRPHLDQVRPVFAAGKPVFIDKPLAGSLVDAIAIAKLGDKYHVPWFSSSALRFGPKLQRLRHGAAIEGEGGGGGGGGIGGCIAWSPCPLEPTHPDLFWYGIHGVEMLYAVMGPGCASVVRVHTDGADVVTGRWADGRIGTFRGIRKGKADYGVVVFGAKSIGTALGFEGYEPLDEQIARFFKTRQPPVSAQETIELMAFMEAADESKRRGSQPVDIHPLLARAMELAAQKLDH